MCTHCDLDIKSSIPNLKTEVICQKKIQSAVKPFQNLFEQQSLKGYSTKYCKWQNYSGIWSEGRHKRPFEKDTWLVSLMVLLVRDTLANYNEIVFCHLHLLSCTLPLLFVLECPRNKLYIERMNEPTKEWTHSHFPRMRLTNLQTISSWPYYSFLSVVSNTRHCC